MKQHKLYPLIVISALMLIISSYTMAKPAQVIEEEANMALAQFYHDVKGSKKFLSKVKGYLVFPKILKAGFVVGGEYGEGVLRVNGETKHYYSLISGSIGFQAGVQQNTMVIAFITKRSLLNFIRSDGWEAGVDGSIAIAQWGAGKDISTISFEKPIVAFVFDS